LPPYGDLGGGDQAWRGGFFSFLSFFFFSLFFLLATAEASYFVVLCLSSLAHKTSAVRIKFARQSHPDTREDLQDGAASGFVVGGP